MVTEGGVKGMSLMERGRGLGDMVHGRVGVVRNVWSSCLSRRLIDLQVSDDDMMRRLDDRRGAEVEGILIAVYSCL